MRGMKFRILVSCFDTFIMNHKGHKDHKEKLSHERREMRVTHYITAK